jgi:glyoxylase-like metal-dependent hydrolase (beta-lactamase superfamily II)
MLGSNYWQEQGIQVIAHIDTATEIKEYGEEVIDRMQQRNGEKAKFTQLTMPDTTFDDKLEIDLGDFKVELLHLGPSHSPGDILARLPQQKFR